jgi:hypothetical protein
MSTCDQVFESPRAHSPLLATGLASINKKFLMEIEDSSLLAARIFKSIDESK